MEGMGRKESRICRIIWMEAHRCALKLHPALTKLPNSGPFRRERETRRDSWLLRQAGNGASRVKRFRCMNLQDIRNPGSKTRFLGLRRMHLHRHPRQGAQLPAGLDGIRP